MLKFFTFFILFLSIIQNSLGQDYINSSFQKNNIYSKYYDNYQDNTRNYQTNYNNNSIDNDYYGRDYKNPYYNNNYSPEYKKPINIYEDNSEYSAQTTLKKNINFKDGRGVGYRVYDNSNRQSYFCDISSTPKKIFTHDNNFNGIYVGAGITKIDASVDFSQTSRNTSNNKPAPNPYKFNYSGSKILPSIIIGQGRLFSSGLFLGQEYAINIGEFKVSSNKIDNGEYSKTAYSFSNYSYYSGKFGFNIFKVFLPYVKLSLSMSSSGFSIVGKNNYKGIFGGSFPSIGYGAGVDISIQDHLRAIIDYTQFSSSADGRSTSSSESSNTYFVNNIKFNSKYAFTRVSLVYKF